MQTHPVTAEPNPSKSSSTPSELVCPGSCPPSSTFSTSSTTSSTSSLTPSSVTQSPSSPFTPPTPPPFAPPLPHLPDDVLRRIIAHLFHDAYRGTPYYPPSTPNHILPLSETSTHMRLAVSKHLTTDLLWLSPPNFPLDSKAEIARHRNRLLAWYNLAAANLRELTIAPRLFPVSSARCDVLATVSAHMPQLRTLDLSGLDGDVTDVETQHALRDILLASRKSLTDLSVDLAAGYVVETVCEANMTAVRILQIRHGPGADALRLLPLLHSLKERRGMIKSRLEKLVVRTKEGLPAELKAEAVADAAPNVLQLEYQELGGGSGDVVGLASAWGGLEEVVVRDGVVDGEGMRMIWERCGVGFVNCEVRGLQVDMGRRVRKLEMTNEIGGDELKILEGFGQVVELGIKVDREAVGGLEGVVEGMRGLKSLSVAVVPQGGSVDRVKREVCQEGLMRALRKVGGGFGKLVVQGESLGVGDLTELFERVGERWEYLVTGIWGPGVSRSLCIVELLRVVRRFCRGFKVLCFGLDLSFDARAREVNRRLREEIEECGRVCEMLDTVWLKRNADSLLSIPRPEGWQDGWIDGWEEEDDEL